MEEKDKEKSLVTRPVPKPRLGALVWPRFCLARPSFPTPAMVPLLNCPFFSSLHFISPPRSHFPFLHLPIRHLLSVNSYLLKNKIYDASSDTFLPLTPHGMKLTACTHVTRSVLCHAHHKPINGCIIIFFSSLSAILVILFLCISFFLKITSLWYFSLVFFVVKPRSFPVTLITTTTCMISLFPS